VDVPTAAHDSMVKARAPAARATAAETCIRVRQLLVVHNIRRVLILVAVITAVIIIPRLRRKANSGHHVIAISAVLVCRAIGSRAIVGDFVRHPLVVRRLRRMLLAGLRRAIFIAWLLVACLALHVLRRAVRMSEFAA
jgi:hypothetical protein